MADTATTTHHLLLAGDIGGTNTRLALYDRKQRTATSDHCGGRYSRPLFSKEYLNEECLEYKVGGNSSKNESENENVRNFVRAIIGPFLEESWESKNVISRTDGKSNPWDGVVIVCCLGVAGPVDPSVDNGTVTTSQRKYLKGLNGRGIAEYCQKMATTNRDQRRTKALLLSCVRACVVVNDFVAQGYGCLSLSTNSGELKRLESNKTDDKAAIVPNGPKVCVGAGTGFGSCYMVPTTAVAGSESEYLCFPSEYGQSDWAPNISIGDNDDDQKRLWKHLSQQQQQQQQHSKNLESGDRHVSVEDVVSGTGLATAYECLWSLFPEKANARVRAKFESEKDLRGRVVGEHTADCELCKRAVDIVVRAYGSVVGSCAMTFLPSGGLYVTGGLLLNLLKKNSGGHETIASDEPGTGDDEAPISFVLRPSCSLLSTFLKAYRCKGSASFLLHDIPLYIVLAKDTGLRGTAVRAEMEFKRFMA